MYKLQLPEIIETYWNVNAAFIPISTASLAGNNRNILECKSEQKEIWDKQTREIIETYWNVNYAHETYSHTPCEK